ncbi:DUF4157 domain-containing protein [bacterium]|nr:DUF4157 domain-containing protein [bacterium]
MARQPHQPTDERKQTSTQSLPITENQGRPFIHPKQVLQRAMAAPDSLTPSDVQILQRTVGNRKTAQLLAPLQRTASSSAPALQQDLVGGGTITPTLENAVQRARSSGAPLADNVRTPMEQALGADFSGVKIHTDTSSDQINRSIQARAFTTGQDIFFRKGEYNPNSQSGQKLVAHELTHVVQQSGQVQRKTFTRTPDTKISAGGVPNSQVIQPARGRGGRVAAGILTTILGGGVLGGAFTAASVVAANTGFGFQKDRKGGKRDSTDELNQVNDYYKQEIQNKENAKAREGVTEPQIATLDAGIRQKQQEGRDFGKFYTATDVSFTARDINESNNEKYEIYGRRYDPEMPYGGEIEGGNGEGKVIILLSGSGGSNEDQLEPVANMYCRQGAQRVYALNYRGYGGSMVKSKSGKKSAPMMSEQGLYNDAYRIYQYVTQQEGVNSNAIVVHGFSLGGAVAANLVKRVTKEGGKLGGLVLHSAIDSAYKQGSKGLVDFPGISQIIGFGTWAQMGSFDTADAMKSISDIDPDLPVHLMSGASKQGDHLALDNTNISAKAGKYFNNVSQHQGTGGHLDDEEITVPSGHVDNNSEDALATFLQSVTDNQGRQQNR